MAGGVQCQTGFAGQLHGRRQGCVHDVAFGAEVIFGYPFPEGKLGGGNHMSFIENVVHIPCLEP